MRIACIALSVVAALAGCEGGSGPRVVVSIDAQPVARASGASLRVRVLSADGRVRLDDVREVGASTAWPLRLPLVPEAGDASRGWIVEATLTDESGAPVSSARARGGYVAGAEREAGVCLYDGCAGEPCGTTEAGCVAGGACETCRAGACSGASAVLDSPGTSPRCPPPACVARATTELACGDGQDDDCDGRVDCLDADCGCDAGACTPIGPEDTLEACHDGIDDDCDGLVDCEEGAACRLPEGPEACDDGIDNDCDGLVDCMDVACCASPACDQRACGANGLRCCDGTCVNTWADERHCGACRLACNGTRQCNRVPAADGTSALGAACRCGGAADCPSSFTCEAHDGASFCNCPSDFRCPGRSVCRMQGAAHHAYCAIP